MSIKSPDNKSPLTMLGAKPVCIVVVDERQLIGECLAYSFRAKRPRDKVTAYTNVIDWIASAEDDHDDTLVLLSIGSKRTNDPEISSVLATIQENCPNAAIVVFADGEDAAQILEALDSGARGYIPTSASLEVTIEALILVAVGGTYIPASSLISARSALRSEAPSTLAINGDFTVRQTAVIDALRKGKANKIIAYELNMRESTVKVHVRNIMKKLKAKNRTEVALMTNSRMNYNPSPFGRVPACGSGASISAGPNLVMLSGGAG